MTNRTTYHCEIQPDGKIVCTPATGEQIETVWKNRYEEVVEILAGKLHCREDCKCTDRREVNRLRAFLGERIKPTP